MEKTYYTEKYVFFMTSLFHVKSAYSDTNLHFLFLFSSAILTAGLYSDPMWMMMPSLRSLCRPLHGLFSPLKVRLVKPFILSFTLLFVLFFFDGNCHLIVQDVIFRSYVVTYGFVSLQARDSPLFHNKFFLSSNKRDLPILWDFCDCGLQTLFVSSCLRSIF